jgi:ATP/ADP translocase/HEAT repeat protein
MTKSFLHKILSRYVEVRPEETTPSLLMFFYFFLITASAWIIKPVKISMFLQRLGAGKLPIAYLLTAVLMGFVVVLNTKLLNVLKRQLYISFSLAFFILTQFLFWIFFRNQWKWLYYIYWFWAEIFLVVLVTQFWILINDIYNPRQAKRLIGFLVSGGLLGGVVGSLLSSFLAKRIGTENLLLICPFMLLAGILIVNNVHKVRSPEEKPEAAASIEMPKPKVGYFKSFGLLRKSRHLMLLAGIVFVDILVTTLVDFQFNSQIATKFPIKNARTAFLAGFFTFLLIFSYFLHILATNRILRNFGIRVALLITPVFLLLGSFSVFFVPFFGAVALKGTDISFSNSLSQSVRELLYIPISPEIKYKAKVFIDMFVNKLAKGLAAILILLFFTLLHFSLKQMSLIVIVIIFLWIALDQWITKEYVNIVKRNLRIRWPDADKLVSEKIDVDMTKLVFETLQSKKRSSVLYAMNLFDLIKKERMSPELRKIISRKSDEVRASSMDSLLEVDGEALMPELDDSLEDESLNTEVKEIMSLSVYQELMKEHIHRVVGEAGKEAEVSRMEAAKVMGMMEPTPALIQSLSKLLRDESSDVVRYAVESAGKLGRREVLPLIIPHLREPSIQAVASSALEEYGIKIIGTLKDFLGDDEEDIRLRKAIPEILARTDSQRAAGLLASELKKRNKDLESELIEAMYRMRSRNPQIHFPEKIVLAEINQRIKECYVTLIEIQSLIEDKKKEFLARDLENNLARTLQRIFELLSLIYPQEDMIKAYQNICAGTRKSIDYSIELLDNIIKKEMMEVLLPLIDDIPLEDKAKKCRKLLKTLEKVEFS